MGLEDYPYDPDAVVGELTGLERLTAIADRSLAQLMHDVFEAAQRVGAGNVTQISPALDDGFGTSPADVKWRNNVLRSALRGAFRLSDGSNARDLAEEARVTNGSTQHAKAQFIRQISQIGWSRV